MAVAVVNPPKGVDLLKFELIPTRWKLTFLNEDRVSYDICLTADHLDAALREAAQPTLPWRVRFLDNEAGSGWLTIGDFVLNRLEGMVFDDE